MTYFDITVDFEAAGELERALRAAGVHDGQLYGAYVPADDRYLGSGLLLTEDEELTEYRAPADWYVTGSTVTELAEKLRAELNKPYTAGH